MLKEKLGDAGPEVVTKISEDRDKAESRSRAANRRVAELEGIVLEMQRQLDQIAEENIKVMVPLLFVNELESNYPVFAMSKAIGR